jgi:hypothetical protein
VNNFIDNPDLPHCDIPSAFEKQLLKANLVESEDLEYQNELSLWEITLSDGL